MTTSASVAQINFLKNFFGVDFTGSQEEASARINEEITKKEKEEKATDKQKAYLSTPANFKAKLAGRTYLISFTKREAALRIDLTKSYNEYLEAKTDAERLVVASELMAKIHDRVIKKAKAD